jgi:Protein of unknown function (DUF3761)
VPLFAADLRLCVVVDSRGQGREDPAAVSVKRWAALFIAATVCAVSTAVAGWAATPASAQHATTAASYCPSASMALNGVYHPSRLHVLASCKRATGTVRTVRREQDGDLHIDVQLIPAFQKLLNAGNTAKQHGWLVVEFMARDGGHLAAPSVGDQITIVGAWVLDAEHGWNEIHPVWRLTLKGRLYTSGPQYGGSPAGDRSKNAEADCRDQHGHPCVGYGSSHTSRSPPPPPPASSSSGGSGAPAGATAKCNDGTYSFSQHRRGTCSHHGGVAVWLRSVPP